MAIDAAAIIRMGSSVLFVLLGLAILAVGRWKRGALALAVLLTAVGASTLWTNLVGREINGARDFVPFLLLDLAIAGSAIALAWCMPTRMASKGTTALAVGVAFGFGSLLGFLDSASDLRGLLAVFEGSGMPSALAPWRLADYTIYYVGLVAWVVAASVRVAIDPPADRAGWTRCAALVALMAPFLVLLYAPPPAAPMPSWNFVSLLVLVLGVTVPWLVAAARSGRRFPILFALFWPALGIICLAYRALPANLSASQHDAWGLLGIFRILGWAFLAYAIIGADLLGVKLPRIAVKRGPVAAGALATLFIVAQVAQNFLSAEYGLVMGGIIAGAFLFMASPIQRAMERQWSGGRPTVAPNARLDKGAEETYRRTLRMSLTDERVTAREEQHLADLGERLGIAARRAVAMRHEVEREKGVR